MEQQNQQPIQEQKNLHSGRRFLTSPRLPLIIAIIAVVVSVGGILLLRTMEPASSPAPVVQQTPPPAPQPQVLDTSGWQTYRSDEFGFEVKYPSEWNAKTLSLDKERRETTAAIFYFPSQFPSFAQANEGFSLNIFYSEKSAEAETDVQKIRNNAKSFFLSDIIQCVEQKNPQVSENYLSLDCYAKGNKGIAIFSVGIEDLDKKYSKPVKQILSTFRFTPQ